jgi:hypothetical protein
LMETYQADTPSTLYLHKFINIRPFARSCQIKMQFWPISDILFHMSKKDPFKYYKTSPEIIKLAVMYYVRYPLSLRHVEDILHERGIDVCHKTIRY